MTGARPDASASASTLWILVVAASVHVVEEYAFDWPSWAEALSGIRVPWGQFFTANAAFLIFAIMAAWLGWKAPVVALSFPALTAINALFFHIGPTLVIGRLSPGTISAVLLYLPIAAWVYVQAQRAGVLTLPVALLSTCLGAGIMAMPFVLFASQ